MAKNVRSETQILKDRVDIARDYLMGKTQSEIALKIGVSRQQIGYDLKAIFLEWKQERLQNFEEKIFLELEKINLIESEAWWAWEKGKKDIEKISSKSNGLPKNNNSKKDFDVLQIVEITETVEGSIPSQRFLEMVFKCIEMRLKILSVLPKNFGKKTDDLENELEDKEEVIAVIELPDNGR